MCVATLFFLYTVTKQHKMTSSYNLIIALEVDGDKSRDF